MTKLRVAEDGFEFQFLETLAANERKVWGDYVVYDVEFDLGRENREMCLFCWLRRGARVA